MKNLQCTVIIPAAGKGKRMNHSTSKQYIELRDKPILVHTLEVFEKCMDISNIILVVGKDEIEYCKKEIIDKYKMKKIIAVIEGGKERQYSVYEGIKKVPDTTDIVLIHDGARPFINQRNIKDTIIGAYKYNACVLGVKVKDTIKRVDDSNNIVDTPDRNTLWSIQTPQTFNRKLIQLAYDKAIQDQFTATDDSMIVEKYSDVKVKIIEGSYSNIKITTQEDLIISNSFFNNNC